ncbi:hypothetical protein BH11MYX2_BH11MYX2_13050 [soil metagenome]
MRGWFLLALLGACGFNVAGSVAVPDDVAIDPPRTLDPATDWEISGDGGTTWRAVALPNVNWGCDNCTRLFRTTVEGTPTSVSFAFSADNKARMSVNAVVVYDEYWIAGYCTDQPCCARCCDSAANCAAHMSADKTLDATKLAAFTAGTNTIIWEASQEVGGSGFTTTMTVAYSP